MWPESIHSIHTTSEAAATLGGPIHQGMVMSFDPAPGYMADQGRLIAPGSTIVRRTDAATSGKSGAPAAYIGDGLPPGRRSWQQKFVGGNMWRWGSCSRNFGLYRQIQA